jgi:drug/metabolite transporter (DMT)-like permease
MPDGRVLAALVALGLVCTALAFIVFFELIREVGTSRGMVFTYVNPAVAVVAGVVFLDEPLTGTIIASFVLILGGSVLATARRSASAAPDPLPDDATAYAPDPAAKPAPEPAPEL